MSDRAGQARALTTFVPIVPGRETALHEHVSAFPRGAGSPLARSARTHVARWVIIDRLPTTAVPRPDRLRLWQLLFSASFDGEEESYLRELVDILGEEVAAIWSHCVGFPGASADAFVPWLREHRVRNSFFFSAYPNATVHDVRNALAARDRVLEFALRGQDLDPAARLRAFREAFP
jgi:hypothetical protein